MSELNNLKNRIRIITSIILLTIIVVIVVFYHFIFVESNSNIIGTYTRIEEDKTGLNKVSYVVYVHFNKKNNYYSITYNKKVRINDMFDHYYYNFRINGKVTLNKPVMAKYVPQKGNNEKVEDVQITFSKNALMITDIYSKPNDKVLLKK